jgi:hypothetical protein
MRNKVAALVAFLVPLLGVTDAARADDWKSVPATVCQKWSGLGNLGTPYYSGTGKVINNDSADWLTLICPFVRDDARDALLNVSAWVLDNSPSADITCTLQAYNLQGQLLDSIARTSEGNSGNCRGLSFPTVVQTDWATYTMTCKIPPKSLPSLDSGVCSFHIEEESTRTTIQ